MDQKHGPKEKKWREVRKCIWNKLLEKNVKNKIDRWKAANQSIENGKMESCQPIKRLKDKKKEEEESIYRRFFLLLFFLALQPPLGVVFYSPLAGFSLLAYEVFLITQRRATVGRTPLDEWSIRRRDLYLTTHNTHNRQTSMPRVGFEPTISAGERP